MSLAPRERQALAAIETELRTSDPVFAVMLTRLAERLSAGSGPRGRSWSRSLARHRPTAGGVVLAIIATLFIVLGVAAAIAATQPGPVMPRHGHAVVGPTVSAPFGL